MTQQVNSNLDSTKTRNTGNLDRNDRRKKRKEIQNIN